MKGWRKKNEENENRTRTMIERARERERTRYILAQEHCPWARL